MDVSIPTYSLPNELEIPNIYISSLCRKFFPITPEIYLAWSGDYEKLQKPLNRLRSFCKSGNHDKDQILDWHKRSKLKTSGISTILVGALRNKEFITVSVKCDTFKIGNKGEFNIVAGTGKNTFAEKFLRTESGIAADPIVLLRNSIIACASILAQQQRNGYGLFEAFGGIFDILVVENNAINPISNILYLFRNWWHRDDNFDESRIDHIQRRGPISSTIESAYHVTHINNNLHVTRWKSGGPVEFVITPPFAEKNFKPARNQYKIGIVVEIIMSPLGYKTIYNFPQNKGYDIDLSLDKPFLNTLAFPNNEICSHLQKVRTNNKITNNKT